MPSLKITLYGSLLYVLSSPSVFFLKVFISCFETIIIQDERDKLQEDFESARKAMEQLKQEKRTFLHGTFVSQAKVSSCFFKYIIDLGNLTNSHIMMTETFLNTERVGCI